MKNYLLGILTMFFVGTIFNTMSYVADDNFVFKIGYKGSEAIQGIWLVKIVADRCDDTQSRCLKSGLCITQAQYFNCDKVQIKLNKLIYGKQK